MAASVITYPHEVIRNAFCKTRRLIQNTEGNLTRCAAYLPRRGLPGLLQGPTHQSFEDRACVGYNDSHVRATAKGTVAQAELLITLRHLLLSALIVVCMLYILFKTSSAHHIHTYVPALLYCSLFNYDDSVHYIIPLHFWQYLSSWLNLVRGPEASRKLV